MAINNKKINGHLSLVILAIMIWGLFNVCVFVPRARADQPRSSTKLHYNESACALALMPVASQFLRSPAAPLPTCCLERSGYFEAIVKTDNDEPLRLFTASSILPFNGENLNNYISHSAFVLIYPPPDSRAIATTIIRE